MSFVDGFFSFNLTINNAEPGVYDQVRLKTGKHPNESVIHLLARVLVFCHRYRDSTLMFSKGLFDTSEPTIWSHDVIGELTRWAEVGVPDKKKVTRALKAWPQADFSVFFLDRSEIESFCHYLRGSKSNWVENIAFYFLDHSLIEDLTEDLETSNSWIVTIVDDVLYLVTETLEKEITFTPIDIWEAFQNSISNE